MLQDMLLLLLICSLCITCAGCVVYSQRSILPDMTSFKWIVRMRMLTIYLHMELCMGLCMGLCIYNVCM